MFRRSTGAGIAGMTGVLMAAAALVSPLAAADLPYEGDRYGSAYDDPRYADIYGRGAPPPRTYTYRPEPPPPPVYDRYEERPPIPRAPVYRDDYPKHAGSPYRDARPSGCPSKEAIRYRLERDGWNDFHAPKVLDDGAALVLARRPSGRLYELMLDRCAGHILHARPLEQRRYGSYSDRYGSRW